MAYTAPRTWVTGELVTATIMNTYVRDNQLALKDPPTSIANIDKVSNYTISTKSTWTTIDGTDLNETITTTGGDVMLWFNGNVYASVNATIYFDVYESVGAARLGTNDGIISRYSASADGIQGVSFVWFAEGLSAAAHTFTLQWKIESSGSPTVSLYAGAGTSNADMHPQFGAREVS